MTDPRTGCPERALEQQESHAMKYADCDVCSEPIFVGDDCYDMPDGIVIHEDCLRQYAAMFRHVWEEN